ncbi:efflux RND transporter periplasmic adaptor subunit [Novosphingobium rosa]|uniref:efflux RND transporter periplasmic adaptor subunit n=1 Tax=Novosphingobium rosa TaxID=76978 RepID=UPI000829BE94|nr:efflux RND transporter periplasmic adaptor subunit [Novosphingobium rosa]
MMRKTMMRAGVTGLALAVAACAGDATPPPPAPVVVLVTPASEGGVELTDDLPGRVVAFRTAEIRPQVGGIVQRRLFEEGGMVRAGEPLFQINPAPFAADAGSAAAALARAEATHARARQQADRLRPLVGADAISRQTFDDAVVARDQAAADVAQARSALTRRRLDLGFARVTSPIAGQIGAARVTEGALVSTADTAPMATVQQIDKVYIDVRQPAERYERLRQAAAQGRFDTHAPIDIIGAGGEVLPRKGRLLFSDVSVDAGTGNAVVRVLVDNPGRRLLPGMFVRARLPRLSLPHAVTVPQQAVSHDAGGKAQVHVVDRQERLHDRDVQIGDVVDGRYLILSGLRAGERVVVVGMDHVQPGAPVKALPWKGDSVVIVDQHRAPSPQS